jgi:hypothetical protein
VSPLGPDELAEWPWEGPVHAEGTILGRPGEVRRLIAQQINHLAVGALLSLLWSVVAETRLRRARR